MIFILLGNIENKNINFIAINQNAKNNYYETQKPNTLVICDVYHAGNFIVAERKHRPCNDV
jgi:hypothetical protein